MAEAVVSFAIERLGDLLVQEAISLQGMSDQVEKLQSELRRMQCFLKDADARQTESEILRNWVAEIRDVAYDAENVIEIFSLKVANRRDQAGMKNALKRLVCILNEWKTVYSVGSEIKAITTKIFNLTRSLQTYGINDTRDNESSNSAYQRQQQLRRSYSHVAEQKIVGLEGNIKVLVDRIVMEKWCQVVSICGMGGLGKTTLAKEVYRHDEVKRYFDCFAWSCISKKFHPRDIWEEILVKLTSPLVILDDIWDKVAWDSLKAAFPNEETGSKLLFTSRQKEVAEYADRSGFLYEPRFLSGEESWELLHKTVIPRKDAADFKIDGRMEELGKQMVKHCAGLPLPITVLGGLLRQKYTLNQWKTVHENIKTYITRGIVGAHGKNHSAVSDVFSLSYDDLPPHLKQCLLYLGHFPEDYKIEVCKLINLWIAEGIVTSLQHKGENKRGAVEDLAEGYLDELIERCMVLVEERDIASSKILPRRMHDLMRDLCLSKAEEESFLQIISPQPQDDNDDVLSSSFR